jgi:hypothetical protein
VCKWEKRGGEERKREEKWREGLVEEGRDEIFTCVHVCERTWEKLGRRRSSGCGRGKGWWRGRVEVGMRTDQPIE